MNDADFYVDVIVINKTNQDLVLISKNATQGDWKNVPSRVNKKSESHFTLEAPWGFIGSEGTFKYSLDTGSPNVQTMLSTYQTDGYRDDNAIRLDQAIPQALFAFDFYTSVDGHAWQHNTVEPRGHPFTVKYFIDYQKSKTYRFTVLQISAYSGHPIRNSKDELIFGDHTLWQSSDPDKWKDGSKGSFAPNIFPYDFSSPVPSSSNLILSVKFLDIELVGAECLIFGELGGERICQSDYFFIKSLNTPQTVTGHIIKPDTSSVPFVQNGDVVWGAELRLSQFGVECVEPKTSRLELYWIAKTLHPAFEGIGVPVQFLRDVFRRDSRATAPGDARGWFQLQTRRVFGPATFNKIYDTISGASAFGVCSWGGIFSQGYYLAPNATGGVGTLYRYVNCMDQSAMLELCCSLITGLHHTSWLVQSPFGYINTTFLVGIVDNQGNPIPVNNPFFGTDQARALVGIDDTGRTSFGLHVYQGWPNPFVRGNDQIYDACGGPHIGETAADYVTSVIDLKTDLYAILHTNHGSINNIQQGSGVTGIDGHHWKPPRTSRDARTGDQLVGSFYFTPISYAKWPQIEQWLPSVLDSGWGVKFRQLSAGDGFSHGFWHLEGPNAVDQLRVNVYVHAISGDAGHSAFTNSHFANMDYVTHILASTDRKPKELWAPITADPEFGRASIQYLDVIKAGRFVVITNQHIVDISGMSSTAALKIPARKLLQYTKTEEIMAVPIIFRGPVSTGRILGFTQITDAGKVIVHKINTRFSFGFELLKAVAAGGASNFDSAALLFDKFILRERGHVVDFDFIARKLGNYTVKIHLMDAESMVSLTREVDIEVLA